jgi:hypothetical protein
MNVVIKVDYQYYEPNKGLEEIQAEIYNNATKKYDEPPTNAEQIRTRREVPDFDSKTARYAFDEQEKPLAFIQATIRPNNVFISYPWAVENCPKEVQAKLFDDMVYYIKEKNLTQPTVIGSEKAWTEVLEFIKGRKFTEQNSVLRYSFKIDDLANIEVPNFKTRKAEQKDIPDLLELLKKEPAYDNYFESNEAAKEFFKGRIERGAFLIFDNEKLISAGGTADEVTDEGVYLQFTVTNVKKMDGWKVLLVSIAKRYKEKGFGDRRFIITPDLEPEQVKFYEDNNAEIWSDYTNYLVV